MRSGSVQLVFEKERRAKREDFDSDHYLHIPEHLHVHMYIDVLYIYPVYCTLYRVLCLLQLASFSH